jgi:aspartyl-tRNA(Asn)/glutamyl-tRNA(Gln) amidotransferase subunit B
MGSGDRAGSPCPGHLFGQALSGAATAFGAEPNTQVSLIDAAMPGMLPVPNRECIRQAVRTGIAINAQINKWSRFDRKNYFYADLPQGYQISQLYHPLVGEGSVEIAVDEKKPDETKTIGWSASTSSRTRAS